MKTHQRCKNVTFASTIVRAEVHTLCTRLPRALYRHPPPLVLGQLGHGDDHSVLVPRRIEALSNDAAGGQEVASVSAGGTHSAAVMTGGDVYTWGGSSYGQVTN